MIHPKDAVAPLKSCPVSIHDDSTALNAIACVDSDGALGKENRLLFHIKEDLNLFKEVTSDNIVIMGRKTFESMDSKPLKNRINIILTRDKKFRPQNDLIYIANNTNDVFIMLRMLRSSKEIEKRFGNTYPCAWVIGGAEIYKLFQEEIKFVCITTVQKKIPDADAFFPLERLKQFSLIERTPLVPLNTEMNVYKNLLYDSSYYFKLNEET